ncbi:hypothetical protein VNO77_19126 [Canavalia gladiata]|uniref:Uncharacterized protein n=1 Tax=Canavalia gladiata TaxID=3824 RepID=A0AAN9LQF5_CANGL
MCVMTTELRKGALNLVPSMQNSDEWKLEHKLAALDRFTDKRISHPGFDYLVLTDCDLAWVVDITSNFKPVIVCASANPALFGEDKSSETIESMLWCERKTKLPYDPKDGYTIKGMQKESKYRVTPPLSYRLCRTKWSINHQSRLALMTGERAYKFTA